MSSPVAAVVDGLGRVAARQVAHLLAVAVHDASFELHPAVRALARDLRAWSLASAQQDAGQVFRNTPPGVPVLAATSYDGARCAGDRIDIAEAARRTGLSTGVLRRHCRRGRYGAAKGSSGAWSLDARAVDARASVGSR